MVCLRCDELTSAYHNVLVAYADLVEFRRVVVQGGQTFVLIQDQLAETENRMREEWFTLSERRSTHRLVP
jgi:hypothetical protein